MGKQSSSENSLRLGPDPILGGESWWLYKVFLPGFWRTIWLSNFLAVPITVCPGSIKKKLQPKSIGQVQKMAETDLMRRYGVMGQHIWRLSRAMDRRRVHRGAERKSISNETTFFDDISNGEELERILWRLSESVATSAKKKETCGRTITMKLRTTDFKIRTRSRTLEDPTMLADVIFSVGRELLAPEVDGTPFRLIGIGISALEDAAHADPPDLIDPERTRRAVAERAMDQVRGKFGNDKIGKGRGLKPRQQDG